MTTFQFSLPTAHWSKLATAHNATLTDAFKKKMNTQAAMLLQTYKDLDFVSVWPEKLVTLACFILRSLMRSESLTPTDRALREMVENANDYSKIVVPLRQEVVDFVAEETKYHKIRTEMETWGKLNKRERITRRTYTQFIMDIIKNAKNIAGLEAFCKGIEDENSRFMYNIGLHIYKKSDAALLKRYPGTSESERSTWIKKNMKFLCNLWSSDFKKFVKGVKK